MEVRPCCDRKRIRGPNNAGEMVCPVHCSKCGHERKYETYLGFCNACHAGGACSDRKKSFYIDNEAETTVFVSVLMPFHDGSGVATVLGVHSTKEKAEAHCYRAVKALGYDQPTAIFEQNLDKGCDNVF